MKCGSSTAGTIGRATPSWATERWPEITRRTPGSFRTRIVTHDVTPSLNVYYKNTRIKQYHKENRALRTETTINFGIGKRSLGPKRSIRHCLRELSCLRRRIIALKSKNLTHLHQDP
jgi:hypothetical protein